MIPEHTSPDKIRARWFIDPEWYEKNNRSITILAQDSLCNKCVEKFAKKKKKPDENDIFEAISGCCSRSPDYITGKMPIMESIFRIIISNKNKPMSSEEIGKQLAERRNDVFSISTQTLNRLLSSDHWYGFKRV